MWGGFVCELNIHTPGLLLAIENVCSDRVVIGHNCWPEIERVRTFSMGGSDVGAAR